MIGPELEFIELNPITVPLVYEIDMQTLHTAQPSLKTIDFGSSTKKSNSLNL
jgi:hypothetical protein